jgi:quercetin dioxygenase-like cupin family protein
MTTNATKPRYRVNFDDVPEIVIPPRDPSNKAPFKAKKVAGAQASIMLADRGSGYHTKPHIHDCEQWNYIIAGEIWFFVEQYGYRCRKGDIMRIPRNRPHWAYNRSNDDAVVFECHAPLLVEERSSAKTVWLLDDRDDKDAISTHRNNYIDFSQAEIDEIEARAFAEED